MESIDFNAANLIILLKMITDASSKIKKNTYNALAHPLCNTIWNWITNHPNEFTDLCTKKTLLKNFPDTLFDQIDDWISSSQLDSGSRKVLMWPLQTLLMILAPETLTTVVMNIKQGKVDKNNKKVSFQYQSVFPARTLLGKD